jgi:hypothetical protein
MDRAWQREQVIHGKYSSTDGDVPVRAAVDRRAVNHNFSARSIVWSIKNAWN